MFNYECSLKNPKPISDMDLKLYYFGTQNCESEKWGPTLIDHYKVVYVTKGKGAFKTKDQKYTVSKNQCFLISPNTISSYRPDDKNQPWSYFFVAFNGLNAASYLSRANLTTENPIIKCTNKDLIKNCFDDMINAVKYDKSGDIRLISSLYLFLSLLVDTKSGKKAKDKYKSNTDMYVHDAMEFVQANYSRKISVADIADHINISRRYFSALFKDAVGKTPQQFLINYRLKKACELLKMPGISIGEIARAVGYEDQLLFSRTFKKFKGVSPNKFRKSKKS